MNDIIESKRPSAFKIIIVLILIGVITFASIKLVKTAPEAFTSLASIAESLTEYKNQLAEEVGESKENNEDNLTVTSNKTLAPVGETVELNWEKVDANGSYTFSYTCTEGVALNILNIEGIKNIDCDKVYNIGNQSSLSITADSEKNRFSEVSYTIAFLGTNDTEPRAIGMASLTIVNEKISLIAASEIKTDTSTTSSTSTVATNEVNNAPTPKPVVKTPTPKPVVTVKPVYEQEFIYAIPASDPNGKTDIGVKFLNSGTISRNTFSIDEIEQNENGAIQFEVKNYGNKTSSDWTFSVKLPNGETYTSSKQSPLKPNERAVLAISFDAGSISKHNFVVTISEKTDTNTSNNKFSKTITFVK